jgi:hypothetical protein
MDLCVSVNEEREYGVVACVNDIIMSDVLYGIGLAESASALPCLAITAIPFFFLFGLPFFFFLFDLLRIPS